MASGVLLRRKIISDHLNNIPTSARFYFTALNLGHAKSTNLLDSRTFSTQESDSKKNVMVTCELLKNSAFGLFTSRCYVNIASGIGKPDFGYIMGPRTTTSRFISYGPTYFGRESWASNYKSQKDKALSRLSRFRLRIKLLWASVSISLRLLVKVCGGESLSRRERQLLTRTTSYIIRDVPGALMIGVPFISFLLPVFLKLFPNMLRPAFQDKLKEQARKRKLKARIEFAKFLQDTAKEMDQVVQISWGGGYYQTAGDLFNYVDRSLFGRPACNEKFWCFANLFNDKITLDNISRRRLVNMCKYMGITAYGSDEYLRFMLRERLKSIREDDKLIQKKGVESLSEDELSIYCRERGICAGEEMRQQVFEQIL